MAENETYDVAKMIDDANEMKRRIDKYDLATPMDNLGYYLVLSENSKASEASRLKEREDMEKNHLKIEEEAVDREKFANERYIGSGPRCNKLDIFAAFKKVFIFGYQRNGLSDEEKYAVLLNGDRLSPNLKFLGAVFNLVAMDWLDFQKDDMKYLGLLKARKDKILLTMCGACYPEQNSTLYEWVNSTDHSYVARGGMGGVPTQFVEKIKDDGMDVVQYTQRDLAHFNDNGRSVISGIISSKNKEAEVAKKQKIMPDFKKYVVNEVEDGARWFTYCNLFCCKDVVPDFNPDSTPCSKEFRRFLDAMRGLSMKDVFLYVLQKQYMDIGPKQSVFRQLFGAKRFPRDSSFKKRLQDGNIFPEFWNEKEKQLFAKIKQNEVFRGVSMVLVMSSKNIVSVGRETPVFFEAERNVEAERNENAMDVFNGSSSDDLYLEDWVEEFDQEKWVVMWVALENEKSDDVVSCEGIELASFEKLEDAVRADVLLRFDEELADKQWRNVILRVKEMKYVSDYGRILETSSGSYVLSVVDLN